MLKEEGTRRRDKKKGQTLSSWQNSKKIECPNVMETATVMRRSAIRAVVGLREDLGGQTKGFDETEEDDEEDEEEEEES